MNTQSHWQSPSLWIIITSVLILVRLVSECEQYELTRLRKRNSDDSGEDVNRDGKYVGNFNEDCFETLFISPYRKIVTIEPDNSIIKQKGVRCHWNVFGTEHCIPVLNCKKFKLTPNRAKSKDEPCSEDYLEVTDGSGGLERYCGTDAPRNITTAKGLRDLYITFKGIQSTKSIPKRGFRCTVFCSNFTQAAFRLSGLPGNRTILADNFEPSENDYCTCGRKPPGNRIVGGEDTTVGEFPWMAALVAAGTRRPYCGGTIINDRFILTAAHCFKGPYAIRQNFQILLNVRTLDLTSTIENQEDTMTPEELAKKDAQDATLRFEVEKYFLHPLYVRQTNDYDVGLIKIKGTIDFHKHQTIQPACLPNLATYAKTYEGVHAIVAGWGLNAANATETMAILQKLDVPVLKQADCKSFFSDRFSRRMLCAGFKEGGKDACKGDSGSFLISEKSPQLWQIIGTVSWGEDCAKKNSPGVYQRISEVNQWIRYVANREDAVWCRE